MKFSIQNWVVSHKSKYFVIETDPRDSDLLRKLIEPHVLPSMEYKLPMEIRPCSHRSPAHARG